MKNSLYSNRNIIAIDLKSFFASVECTQRGLDPFTTALVVCDPTRNGAITLAVTPFLKKLGVPSRGRAYDLPKNIKGINPLFSYSSISNNASIFYENKNN